MGETTAARSYEYSPGVRRQLENLPALGGEEFWQRVAVRDKGSPGWLDAEVLVIALRRFLVRADLDAAKRVAWELVERWGKFAASEASHWFASPEDRDDFRQEVATRLMEELADPAERFWEANFIHALRCLCYDVRKRMHRGRDRDQPLHAAVDHDGEPIDEPPDIADPDPLPVDHALLREENRDWFGRAMARLPADERQVVFLFYVSGWKIASAVSDEVTISGTLGVTEKTVRNRLRRAKEKLRTWYERENPHGRA